MTPTPQTLIEQLERDEGRKPSAYQDSRGFWTIGIGVCIDGRLGCGLDDEEMDYLTARRVERAAAALSQQFPWTDALDPVRRDALLNMAYQMGIHGLAAFRQMLALLEAGDYTGAAAAGRNSVWAETQSPARADRLMKQIESGERQ